MMPSNEAYHKIKFTGFSFIKDYEGNLVAINN